MEVAWRAFSSAARRAASSAARRFASAMAASWAAACRWSCAARAAAASAARSFSAILCLDVALRVERGLERRGLLGLLLLGGGAQLGEARLQGRELVAPGLQRCLLVTRHGARIGQRATPILQRLAAQLELGADGADVIGEQRVLLGDRHEVADLGGRLVQRVGGQQDLQERRLGALVGGAQVILEKRLPIGEVGAAAADVDGHALQLVVERGDLRPQLGDPGLDVGHLLAHLDEQGPDVLVLGRDGLELGTRQVELRVEVGRAPLELRELRALAVEGSLKRLLGRPRVLELSARLGQFGLGIGGKGRAAGLCCKDGPAHGQQGDERDSEAGSPPHRAVIRTMQLPFAPLRESSGRW